MKNFLIGLVCGLVLAGLAAFIFVFAALRLAASFGERQPQVPDTATIVMNLQGDIAEKPAPEIPIPFFEQKEQPTVAEVWMDFRKAAADSRVKAILLEPRGLSIGWARLEELHRDLLDFRKSGKPVYAFLRNPSGREYYLATAADRVYMSQEDILDVKGLAVEGLYLKGTLDKIGVKADVIHAGKYKDAGDIFTQTGMSPQTREVLNDVLDQYYGDLVSVVAQGRKKSPEAVRALIDQGPFTATTALSAGLIDGIHYEDQVREELRRKIGGSKLQTISVQNYTKVSRQSAGLHGGKRIAIIAGAGAITSGLPGPFADAGISAPTFTRLLRDIGNDVSIRGVILRIDSPGGEVLASDDILHAAKELSRKKPLVISMGDTAASGGYYMAVTGDPILAYPDTLTGSIGVIWAKFNLHGLYDKIGIQKDLLSRGRFADLYSDYAPMTDAQRQKITAQIDSFYSGFVSRVASGRKKPVSVIEPLAQGRVWTGAQARGNGLVDELGGLDRALAMVRQRAGMKPNENVTIVTYPRRKSILEQLFNRNDQTSASAEAALQRLTGNFPWGALLSGGYLRLMPFTLQVR